ncbi:MAG: phosphoadenylyl-sulfate reductase [Saprospiraceae bacterium]|nr:phosphoadenylyl-sulfate reductase [Saprospiraceae bacterium]
MNYAYIDIDLSTEELSEIFRPYSFEERLEKLYDYFDIEDILVTSSFGTKSVFLLHLLSKVNPDQKIHFIDTTYHFPETITYKNQLIKQLGLNVVDVFPQINENALTREENWWIAHPKMCCTINKIGPLEPIVAKHKVWIAGLMSFQTAFRSHLDIFTQQGDIIKFHPFIDIDEGEFLYHLSYHNLPKHPLEALGFGSIGCTHCTEKGEGRSGRWASTGKTECGLHPNYFLRNKT